MIHYSAHNGTPLHSALASQALRNLHTPLPIPNAPHDLSYASALSTIFATTSSILSAVSNTTAPGSLGGGGILNVERIAVLADGEIGQILGMLSAWSAGGVAVLVDSKDVNPEDFSWVSDLMPEVILYPLDSDVGRVIDAHYWAPISTSPDPARVAWVKERSQQAEADANPGRGYTTASDEAVAQMMVDLKWIELDKEALFVPFPAGPRLGEDEATWGPDAAIASDPTEGIDGQHDEGDDESQNEEHDEERGEDDGGEHREDLDAHADRLDDTDALAPSSCWMGPPYQAEGTTYTHRDIATFVLGLNSAPGSGASPNTDGLEHIPALVALAELLRSEKIDSRLVIQA